MSLQPAVAGLLIGTVVLCLVIVQQYRTSEDHVVLDENAKGQASPKSFLKSSAVLRQKARMQQLAMVSASSFQQPAQYVTQVCSYSCNDKLDHETNTYVCFVSLPSTSTASWMWRRH
jgi:hypothetical protein